MITKRNKRQLKQRTKKPINQDTGIAYTGIVEIGYMRGKKVFKSNVHHNTGRLPLFRLLANALIGDVKTLDDNRPQWIRLFNEEDTSNPNFSNEVGATSISVSDLWTEYGNNDATACFRFVIPNAYLPAEEGIKVNLIAFYSNATSQQEFRTQPHAYIVLTEPIDNDGKSDVVLTWKMTIANPGEN